jgi:RimJ/RimL family protein N-acetyltransferase
MPSRLPLITAAATAERIQHRPETINLADARAIYVRLAEKMNEGPGRYTRLSGWLQDLVFFVQRIIDTPAPTGLVASARLLKDADKLVELANEARSDIATVYDRFHSNTAAATEALEIITAWAFLQETADDLLRSGALPAAG